MNTNTTDTLLIPVSTEDHILGNPDAVINMVEYADFECRECAEASRMIRRVMRHHSSSIVYAFRHFPHEEVHPNAERAAEAAEAAAAQSEPKFWEMHNLLFAHQDDLDENSLASYAEAIGLDLERFVSDLDTGVHLPRINRDYMRGLQNGVQHTPTFFINNHVYVGLHDLRILAAAVRDAWKRSREGFV